MFNQIRRLWADNGSNDKSFTVEEQKLKHALSELKKAADSLSNASTVLSDLLSK